MLEASWSWVKRILPSQTHMREPRRQPLGQTYAWDLPCSINFLFLPQGSLTSRDYALSKCYLPFEDTVLITYSAAAGFLTILILVHFEHVPSSFLLGRKLCRLHMRR